MKSKIEENNVLNIVKSVLLEEASKVNRNDFNKVQFKMDELESQLMETIKELRKLEDSIPDGLKTITNGRVKAMSSNLSNTHVVLKQLKGKVKNYKKSLYQQQVDEKK
jgi:esterase/lipase